MIIPTNSILYVGHKGLFQVYCDFYVFCIKDVGSIKLGDIVTVHSVKTSKSGQLVFVIKETYYYHYYFILLHH